MSILSSDEFAKVYYECDGDITLIQSQLRDLGAAEPTIRPGKLRQRISNLQRKGVLPLESGNSVEPATILKSVSTSYDALGNIKSQRITSHVPKDDQLHQIYLAIQEMASSLTPLPARKTPPKHLDEHLTNVIISNDLHFGLLTDQGDTTEDWRTTDIINRVRESYDYLYANMPKAKYAVVVDLGDILEAENDMRMTRRSGNILDTDGKYANHFRAAYEAMIYAVEKALETHDKVYFYNVHGNHEESQTAMALREIIRVKFSDNPDVIVNTTGHSIKYHKFGSVLLQFFHGHAMKMRQAPEVMACDAHEVYSQTKFRYGLAGHVHKDSVYDSPIARIESFRTIIPNNTYAFDHGYRTNHGSMTAITYHADLGEVSRTKFNIQDQPLNITQS